MPFISTVRRLIVDTVLQKREETMSTRQDKSLHNACAKGKVSKVREILQSNREVASLLGLRLGFLGYTPLHEAACQGHYDVLQLLLIYGPDFVDVKANGNYTPLHIAASMDYVKCIKVLLKNNANIMALDDFHKTPYQTAVQHKRKESAKCLKSAEIIQAAGRNSQDLNNLLDETSSRDITTSCFDDALIEACHRGNFEASCMLLVAGAKKIKESICIAIRYGHYRISALLLLCFATLSGDMRILATLLDRSLECSEWLQQFVDDALPIETVIEKIRESLKDDVEDCTTVAIKLPGLGNPVDVLKELLSNTSCRVKEKKVNWSKLFLSKIHESWLLHIKSWVEYFNLSNNKLTSLPETLIDLKMVVSLNLSHNKLKIVPSQIFSLISLRYLNLSSNAIAELPEIAQWRPVFKSLNVSDNNLAYLPASLSRSCIETLNLSRNHFTRVPRGVCEITSLRDLDLSDNREINYLPDEMGKLRNLTHINLKNLDQITDPPEAVRRNAEDLVATLRRKLRNCEPYYTMKLMLVGKGGQGKTTLVHRLRSDFTFKENDLTQGVEISDLSIQRAAFHREFIFKVWDFGGQEDYYATHQCFLSRMSLYLLVWRLIDGEHGVASLTPWLDNIAVRSPGSTVIIVGTHLDCIASEKYGADFVQRMKILVRELVNKSRYSEKVIVPPHAICAVSCAFGGSRTEINSLRLLIYETAASLRRGRAPVMGELIPSSFISLIHRIEKRKAEIQAKHQLPIIRKEEFDAMVRENSLLCRRDIQDPMDVRDATVFLRERGIVMHFDDPNEGLSDLYFIEPRWLCALMARVITVKTHADFVKDGVLELGQEKIKILFKREDIPPDFFEQYIRLLVRFQIAYLLDASRILVPSKLPEEQPEVVTKLQLPYAPVRRVYKIDYQRIHGFWPRFMSRFFFYLKEMIAVDATRYQKAEDSEHGFFGHFCPSCLRVDASAGGTFTCFLDGVEWETGSKSKDPKRPSSGADYNDSNTSSSKRNTVSQPTTTAETQSTVDGPTSVASKKSIKVASSKKAKEKQSRKSYWRKDASKKKSTKNEPTRKGALANEPTKVNGATQNAPIRGPSVYNGVVGGGGQDFHALLLDPSVRVFSDEELYDETDDGHIVINNVDTAMDYGHRPDSFYGEKKEHVKRAGLLDLRIPSFDDSLSDHDSKSRASSRASQKSTTANSEDENTRRQRSDMAGKDGKQRRRSGNEEASSSEKKGDECPPSTSDEAPNKSEDVPGLNTSEGAPVRNEDVPHSNEDVLVVNDENNNTESDQNPVGHEANPKDTEEMPTSVEILEEAIPAGNNDEQNNSIEENERVDNSGSLEDVSYATDSEYSKSEDINGAIKIPTMGSMLSCQSEENTSNLSSSDVGSLSSWKNSKGIASLTTVSSSFLESNSFAETYSKDLNNGNNVAQFDTESVANDEQLRDGHAFDNMPGPHNACDDCNSSLEGTVDGEVETSYEVSRSSVSKSESTASSVRSGEPTDTECDVFSESMSSVSTTNENEALKPGDAVSPEAQTKPSQTETKPDTIPHLNPLPIKNGTDTPNSFPSRENNCQLSAGETTAHDSMDCETEVYADSKIDPSIDNVIASEDVQIALPDTAPTIQPKIETTDTGTAVRGLGSEVPSDTTTGKSGDECLEKADVSTHGGVNNTGPSTLDNNINDLKSAAVDTEDDLTYSVSSRMLPLSNSDPSETTGKPASSSEGIGAHRNHVGEQSETDGPSPEDDGTPPDDDGTPRKDDDPQPEEDHDVETKKCTLCKENVAADQLVTIALDVAELIDQKILHCWRSGVCFTHPEAFLVIAYRPLSDSIVVEIASSPNPLGRRLLTFVVDHLDTLIKEWYPGLLTLYGPEPTIQKLIPCRSCEKEGNRRPHMLTFDSCVTQYSMGHFVKCPEHEVSIQDIAPDVVLQDIDADLLLEEDELEYERSDANMIGKGGFGKVYRGRCRQRDAAIKEYSSPTCEDDAMKRYREVRNEVNVLRRFGQHPFLVNLIGVCLRPFRLVLELAMEGSLAKTLYNAEFFIERVVMYRMLYQIADALNFLHSLYVIYRDLKPQNVLVMSYEEKHDVNIKLTDFGTAAFQFNEGLVALEGTVGFLAPEMLKEFCKRIGYTERVDVFSLGILVYCFITRREPFFNVKTSAEVNSMTIAGRRPEYDDVIQARIGLKGLTWLMDNCLAYEPNMRPNAASIAQQLRAPAFQLFMGLMALPCPQSVRHVCLVEATMELWVAVDDRSNTMLLVYVVNTWCLKKKFTINRLGTTAQDPVLCLQVNCIHVTGTEVLIGLRGDRDVVAVYDAESYQLKRKISLEEPVFSLSSNASFIFIGLSGGDCLVTSRTKTVHSIEVSHSQPVTCVMAVGNEHLWLTAGKCIQIFHMEEQEKTPAFELNAVRFSTSSAPFSQTALSADDTNIWCISKGDSVVTAWNINTRQKSLEIDCKAIFAQFASEGVDSPLEVAVTCVLPVLNTVWIGTGGGKLLIVDANSGELITSLNLFDDHVRTLTLVPGPGPCGTEKYYVVVSGRNVKEDALFRGNGKIVCRVNKDVIERAPRMQTTPVKTADKAKSVSRSPFAKPVSPQPETTNADTEDGPVDSSVHSSVLMFFEALPAEVLRRTESMH